MLPSEHGANRVGYVLKMYPRFSETFIVNEILALEARGQHLEIFSLRSPLDGRFHETLAEVRAAVTYLPHPVKATDVWSILGRGLDRLPELAVNLSEVLELSVGDAACAVELALHVRERDITHLHAHFGSVATSVARAAARLAGVPYSFTAHAKDIFHESVAADDLRRKLADAATVVTVSDYNLDHLRRTYGSDAGRVVRVYNGLDLDRFTYSPPTDRPPAVVGVGRLVEKKGFTHLVDAIALLVRDGREVRLDLIGTGEQEQLLRARVNALGLDGRVRFRGPLPQGQTRDAVRGASALAAPCIVGADGNRDGLPTVLLESMALGTPCVATPVTGIPEAVRHDETGLLVREGDVAGLAGELARLLDDTDLRCRLAAAARALIEHEFDVRRAGARLQQIFGIPTSAPAKAEAR